MCWSFRAPPSERDVEIAHFNGPCCKTGRDWFRWLREDVECVLRCRLTLFLEVAATDQSRTIPMARNSIGGGLYKLFRQAAKIPYELIGEVAKEKGTYFNQLEGDLSQETYEELCADTADVVLETIYYCQSELGIVGKSLQGSRKLLNAAFNQTEQKKRLINHDFLILKIQSGPRHNPRMRPPLYIKAEKVAGDSEGKAGIYIFKFKEDEADIDKYALHRIDCRSSRFGSLLNLVETLKHNSPDYDLVHNNCWDYALETTQSVLKVCIQIASNSVGSYSECRRLQKELNELEANIGRKHGLNQAKRAIKFVQTKVVDLLE